MTTVACLIPAFNKARLIEGVIAGIPDGVDHFIVVNDASTDDTEEVVRRIARAAGTRSLESGLLFETDMLIKLY